ncbi:MAG: hypothetical protein P4L87_18205, partial [Formivibrio sp.]|nr:hypothetical protein [Formivibrio sp.]
MFVGDGGGMLLWGKASIPINTSAYKQYRQWGYNVTVTIVNTTIHNNTAANSGNGGGIAVENSVPLTLVDSRITNNRASLYGGGVYMDATPNEIRFVGECALSGNSIPVGAGEQ